MSKTLPSFYQQFIHLSRYSRWMESEGRRETWEETVDRYFRFFDEHWNEKGIKIPKTTREELREAVLNLEIMPSMRSLMTAGEALKRDNTAGYNPVSGDTLVLTREHGNVPIRDLCGKNATVLNVNGKWTNAQFRSYGNQPLSRVTLRLNSNTVREVDCTQNHRWVLLDGTVKSTADLQEGDRIPFASAPKPVVDEDYRWGVIHGLVYGDGTATKSHKRVKGYHIRLCGKNKELLPLFEGYPVTYPKSYSGDPVVMFYDGFAGTHDLKSLPSENETESYLLGFVRGWMAADGNVTKSSQVSICTGGDGMKWLEKNGERLGFVVQSHKKLASVTNYGKRKKNSYSVYISRSSITTDDLLCSWKRSNFRSLNSHYVVKAVKPMNKISEVFCAEVPETNTFTLSGGLVTGNCSYVAVNKVRAFDEILYVLMCGTGVGFSVERQYVEKLPTIAEQFSSSDTVIVVKDSKEGWAKSYRELVSLLIGGQIPSWDTSKIRPAGARLKTFGGRASGPRPLEELFSFTVDTFKRAAGRKLTSMECHDIICKVAEVVVVGGVRRSALISLSNLTDERMRNAKSGAWWNENPQRALANNSVAYKEKPEIGTFMEEWLSLYNSKSGERGIFNRDACQKTVEKLGERRDASYEFGTNPCCLDGDTLVETNMGQMPLSAVVSDPDGFLVYSYNTETNEMEYTEILSGDMTRPNAEIIEVEIEDENGESHTLRITPDHQVWTENRGYVDAEKLTENDVVCVSTKWQLLPQETKRMETSKKTIRGKVKQIKKVDGRIDTYDIQTPNQNFFANGVLVHNSEIILRDKEFCNLSEVIVRKDDTAESLKRKVRLAAILGTWQASLTHFPYLSSEWKKNCEEEALLGVSLTGILDNALMRGQGPNLNVLLETLKADAVAVNKEWAKRIGINPAAAITCVKPSGTVSQLTDSASGIHARHNEYYIRTVRADRKDPLCQFMIDKGFPHEPCNMRPDHTMVFSFPMKAVGSVTRNDMTAIEHLELWLTYQRHWCEHKPSITVTVREHEWMEVGAWVYKHFDEISGISFLPMDLGTYKQAPYQDCTKEQYEAHLSKMPKDVDWSELINYEKTDNTSGTQSLACSAGACELVDIGENTNSIPTIR